MNLNSVILFMRVERWLLLLLLRLLFIYTIFVTYYNSQSIKQFATILKVVCFDFHCVNKWEDGGRVEMFCGLRLLRKLWWRQACVCVYSIFCLYLLYIGVSKASKVMDRIFFIK